jgi:thioredoxin-like negative regulator of GroEL
MDKGMIYFSAPWCDACGVLLPVINNIQNLGIKIKKVDTQYDAQYTEQYNVKSIPLLVITDMGGQEIKRIQAGGMTQEQILNWFNS